MRTSRTFLAAGLTGILLGITSHCGSGVCNQYSDCANGTTCTSGKCVPLATDAAADAADGASLPESSADAAPSDAASVTTDAADAASTATDAADASTGSGDAAQDGADEG